MNWKKITTTAVLAVLATAIIVFANGLLLEWWVDTADSFEEAITISWRVGVGLRVLLVGLVYLRLAASVRDRALLHVAVAWVSALALDYVVGTALAFAIEFFPVGGGLGYIGTTALAPLFGYMLYRLRPNNSSKPTPLRGAP